MQLFGPPKPGPEYEVNHKDKNRSNNNINNLEWLTHIENLENRNPYKPHNRITKAEVNQVKQWYLDNYENFKELSPRNLAKLAEHHLQIPISQDCIRINRKKWEEELNEEQEEQEEQ